MFRIEVVSEIFTIFVAMETETDQQMLPTCGLGMGKSERLRHKRLVDRLFREGKSFYAYPLRVVYVVAPAEKAVGSFKSRHIPEGGDAAERLRRMNIESLQMMVNIPKRKMRHAVDRVRLRRLVREAWRLSRVPLRGHLSDSGLSMSVALLYVSNEKLPYRVISQRMTHIMSRLEAAAADAAGKGEAQ